MAVAALLLSLAATALTAPAKRAVPSFVYPGDAPYSVPAEKLASVLTCPNGYPTADSPPVLLVHGTFATGIESWSDTYVPALKQDGYTACYIELPGRASIDVQVSAEYVAYNLHYLSQLSGGAKTAVVTHSQGGLNTQWALQYFPSTKNVTSFFLPLSPDWLGVTWAAPLFLTICPLYQCQPSVWQQQRGSALENALRDNKYFKANVPTNAVWTENDEIITPPRDNAQLPGGTAFGVQELCPGRIIDHIYIINDAAAYAIQIDALKNGGTADLNRIRTNDAGVCSRQFAPGMKPNAVAQLELVVNGAVQGFLLGGPRVPTEPRLKSYVYSANA